jgi:hypothetical protein
MMKSIERRWAPLTSAAFALLLTRSAAGNGRYPAADQFAVDPLDANHYVVRTTFGLLQSSDRGEHWSWVCEAAMTSEVLRDPPISLTTSGIVAGLSFGVTMGDRTGCRWTPVTDGFEDFPTTDLVTDPTLPSRIYATQAITGDEGLAARVLESADGGWHWSALGAPVDGMSPLTIEIAGSRPERMYMSGPDGAFQSGSVAVSDDRGATWIVKRFPAAYVYVSGVDPVNADRLYVRADSATRSALYVSEDAGTTWSMIYESTLGLKGFAISSDGRRVGAGSDQEGVVLLTRSEGDGGVSVFTPERLGTASSRCLKWDGETLFACADEKKDGFTLGVSADGRGPFVPLYHLGTLEPAAECARDESVGVCPSSWCPLKSVVPVEGRCEDAGRMDADGARPERDGAERDGNDGGSSIDAVATGSEVGACGCRAGPAPIRSRWLVALAATVLANLRAARRLRSRRGKSM